VKAAIVTGASDGLGWEIANLLREKMPVYNLSINVPSKSFSDYSFPVWNYLCDITSESDIVGAMDLIRDGDDKIYYLINCAGTNGIDYLEHTKEELWDRVMGVNAKGIYLMSKHTLPHLARWGGTILNIVSNAAHVPMTSSIAYNASKGAAHIMTLQMARELMPRHGVTVFGIAPNKLKGTQMSKYIEDSVVRVRGWTEEYAKEYQLASLPAGEETDPAVLAEFIAFLLETKERHKYLHSCILPYGA